METESVGWWNQKCGPREILAISLPLIASTISHTVMQFCDRMFLAWYSNDALAAVLPAGALSWTLASLPLGITMYCATFVAQYFGAEQRERIGKIVWQGIWIGIFLTPLFILLGAFSESFFLAIGHSKLIASLEYEYFFALSLGSGAMVLDGAVSSFFIGRGKTNTVMWVNIFAASLNLGLDYLLIFGAGPLPAMGLWGAGIATTIATWVKVGIFYWMFRSERFQQFGVRRDWRIDGQLMRRFLFFSVPNGLQFVIEGLAFTFFLMMIPRISETASAAIAVVFSINMLVIYPIFGLGMGCSTLVGQRIGENRADLASRATWNSLYLGLIYTSIFGALYVFTPQLFYAAHGGATDQFEEIRPLVLLYLKFVAVYCLFDTVQIIFVSAIKGAGDTRFVVVVSLLTAAIFMFGGLFASNSFKESSAQVNSWWFSLTGWILLLSVIYGIRFLQGKWKEMKVIEPTLNDRV